MKIILYFSAVVACAVALPAQVPVEASDELDWSKITPNNIYVEPINPVEKEYDELPGGRVIGGSEVSRNSVPYQVAIIIDGASFCGGSLISTTRVLTAAHCTIRASYVEVRLGAHTVNTNEATQIRITSTSIINHPSYSSILIANDVAIILLPTAVVLNSNIAIIALAPATAGTYEGSTAHLTGWGRTSDASNAIAPVLHGVNLTIITNAICRNTFGIIILSSTLCTAGTGRVGACNGDSGGPLVVNGVQVGTVSFGAATCEGSTPTAYGRVSSFRTWIQQNAGV